MVCTETDIRDIITCSNVPKFCVFFSVTAVFYAKYSVTECKLHLFIQDMLCCVVFIVPLP